MQMTHNIPALRSPAIAAGLSITLFLGACVSEPTPAPDRTRPDDAKAPAGLTDTRYSGFLGDYSKLRTSPRHPGTLYEQSAKLASYTAFIVEPMTVLPSRTARGVSITDAESTELAKALHEETVEAIRSGHPVVTAPGPNVATLRAAITALAVSRVDPVSGQVQIGGASVEIEIVDSVTRQRLAAAVETDVVRDTTQVISADPYADSRLVFRHWASRLYLWIRDAKELATHP